LIEELNQKVIYLVVTFFDIPKPIIIMTLNWGKVGVTILKLLNELGK